MGHAKFSKSCVLSFISSFSNLKGSGEEVRSCPESQTWWRTEENLNSCWYQHPAPLYASSAADTNTDTDRPRSFFRVVHGWENVLNRTLPSKTASRDGLLPPQLLCNCWASNSGMMLSGRNHLWCLFGQLKWTSTYIGKSKIQRNSVYQSHTNRAPTSVLWFTTLLD